MKRTALILAFTLICSAAALLLPAMPQPLDYHQFVDRRTFFGVPNFLDVASNIGFFFAGALGLYVVSRRKTSFEAGIERVPYAVFFLGVLLTTFGSGYYHLEPDNERLFWDRLPMTIAFMSLVAAQIVDRIDRRTGLYLLVPMLLIGAASVVYWRMTERAGAGNVMPYGILQGYSVVALLAIAVLHRSRYTHGNLIYGVFAAYVIAKLLELFDLRIFELGHVISGHSLKHLAAGVAGLLVCQMLLRRRCAIEFAV
jgi:hypothetical protein